MLLSRDNFRNSVFKRDNYQCVICQNPGQDAHHIIERRLFSDGGYYIDNGATLCGNCHLKAESTELSVEEIRSAAKITKVILPDHLYESEQYDKWGNIILPNGQKLKGELFDDESIQKILTNKHLFTNRVKYPRTYHLPWSNGTDDDRFIDSVEQFKGQIVSVTLKMDGENTTIYNDHVHARSIDSKSHESRNWIKQFSNNFYEIPDNWRICGENLYAKHSIKYDNLESYFLGFSIWENNQCLSWQDTLKYFELLGITSVFSIYYGIFDEDFIKEIWSRFEDRHEGYIIRLASSFSLRDFKKSVAKYVRPNHVTTKNHGWMYKNFEKNILDREFL